MNDLSTDPDLSRGKVALPIPKLRRWQPLRLGLVEMFHYDSEEFWFRDGHLLLRGNNGTGKSKVLSLTLPFLLDAQLKPSRIEPDGDNGKRMAWNLLMNVHDRRIGYAWIEFGRIAEDGTPRYLSLGAGLSAVAARPQVDSWFFVLDDAESGSRINQDLWLISSQRVVLTRERLREALEGRGQMFDTAASYRRAVDERLFRLGSRRYEALMDTLIQLRQPQLSKKPDETALSNALTEALPPLAPELLGDVAEALGQLEEDRRQLEEYQTLGQGDRSLRAALPRLCRHPEPTTGAGAAPGPDGVRQREPGTERSPGPACERRGRGSERNRCPRHCRGRSRARGGRVSRRCAQTPRIRMRIASRAPSATPRRADGRTRPQLRRSKRRSLRLKRSTDETRHGTQRMTEAERALAHLRRQGASHADVAGLAVAHAESPLVAFDAAALADLAPQAYESACADLRHAVARRRDQIATLRRRHAEVRAAEEKNFQSERIRDERQDALATAVGRREQADAEVEREGRNSIESWERHFASLEQLEVSPDDGRAAVAALADWVVTLQGDNPARHVLQAAQQHASLSLARRRVALDDRRQALEMARTALEDERGRLNTGVDPPPPLPHTRAPDTRNERPGAPLWQLVDFHDSIPAQQRAGLEARSKAPAFSTRGSRPTAICRRAMAALPLLDTQLVERRQGAPSLAGYLQAAVPPGSVVPAGMVERILAGIACGDDDEAGSEAWIAPDGRFRLGGLSGAWAKPVAVHVGYAARTAARARRLAEIAEQLAQLADELTAVEAETDQLAHDQTRAEHEWRTSPADEMLRNAHLAAAACARDTQRARERLGEADERCRETRLALEAVSAQLAADATDLRLPLSPHALPAIETALEDYRDTQVSLAQAAHELRLALAELRRQQIRESEMRGDLDKREAALASRASRRKKPSPDSRCCARPSAPGSRSCRRNWPRPASPSCAPRTC